MDHYEFGKLIYSSLLKERYWIFYSDEGELAIKYNQFEYYKCLNTLAKKGWKLAAVINNKEFVLEKLKSFKEVRNEV